MFKVLKGSKISHYRLLKVIKCFCLDIVASKTALLLRLNRNTVNRFYGIFRRLIFLHHQSQMKRLAGIVEADKTFFGPARDGYTWGKINLSDIAKSLSFHGLWKFMLKYPSICSYEIWRSISRKEFCRSLQRLVPEPQEQDLETGSAGVRAQAMFSDRALAKNFSFEMGPGILRVVNAPRPAATASLTIGHLLA